MSMFSGKCDVCDCLVEIHQYTEEELRDHVKIYVGNSETPLKIESMKDLIPYYPYIIGSSGHDNVSKSAVIHISAESYVDRQEREMLDLYLKYALRYYNRCKRKKVEFNTEEAVKEIAWAHNEDIIREIVQRVKEKGKKANTEGLHIKWYDVYRKNLVDEMLKNGLNPADYGYGRFVKEEK